MRYKHGLHIFRRDLRLNDNTALLAAAAQCEQLSLCFILDPRQLEAHPYRSKAGAEFMLQALTELRSEIRERGGELNLLWGEPERVLPSILTSNRIDALYLNLDYTPFSRARDGEIERVCKDSGVAYCPHHDALLNAPGQVLKSDGTPYTVYTPFAKRARLEPVKAPQAPANIRFERAALAESDWGGAWERATQLVNSGTTQRPRAEALMVIEKIGRFKDYSTERDLPALDRTTRLAPHHKFGVLSVRETYQGVRDAFGEKHILLNELYWRDFFTHIAWHFPHVFDGAFHRHYDKLPWSTDSQAFERWCNGETGFPLVDAGMRELNETGFMHNRVRMVVASFLVKDLHINWRWGEQYFAQKLRDYDPAVNNGNWQWAASTGCDAQPYFRIFNPWRQQERFDPECVYIKRWVPELAKLSAKDVHRLEDGGRLLAPTYPAAIVEHRPAAMHAEKMYRELGLKKI